MPTETNSELDFAENYIKKAKSYLEEGKRTLEESTYRKPYSNVIRNAQRCVELSVKGMFKLQNCDFPTFHEIDLEKSEEVKQLLDSEFPENFNKKKKIPRAVFLTKFWKQFYEISDYGFKELNIGPDDVLTRADAEWSIKHAEEVHDLVKSLLIHKR